MPFASTRLHALTLVTCCALQDFCLLREFCHLITTYEQRAAGLQTEGYNGLPLSPTGFATVHMSTVPFDCMAADALYACVTPQAVQQAFPHFAVHSQQDPLELLELLRTRYESG